MTIERGAPGRGAMLDDRAVSVCTSPLRHAGERRQAMSTRTHTAARRTLYRHPVSTAVLVGGVFVAGCVGVGQMPIGTGDFSGKSPCGEDVQVVAQPMQVNSGGGCTADAKPGTWEEAVEKLRLLGDGLGYFRVQVVHVAPGRTEGACVTPFTIYGLGWQCRARTWVPVGLTKPGPVAAPSTLSDDDCKRSSACTNYGRCKAVDGECVAAPTAAPSTPDCTKTEACRWSGRCKAVDRQCVAGSDQDCKGSWACSKNGRCKAIDGKCCKAPGDCD